MLRWIEVVYLLRLVGYLAVFSALRLGRVGSLCSVFRSPGERQSR